MFFTNSNAIGHNCPTIAIVGFLSSPKINLSIKYSEYAKENNKIILTSNGYWMCVEQKIFFEKFLQAPL